MYSRDYGNIKSDGQLYNLERGYFDDDRRDPPDPPSPPKREGAIGRRLDLLREMKLDDMLLIAIGVLLLLDSDADNDMIALLIAALLFF